MTPYEIASIVMSSLSLIISLVIALVNFFKSKIRVKLKVLKILNLGSNNYQYNLKLINNSQNSFTVFGSKNCELLNNEDMFINPDSTNSVSLLVVFPKTTSQINLKLLTTKGKIRFRLYKSK